MPLLGRLGFRSWPALIVAIMLTGSSFVEAGDDPVYELRMYTCEPNRLAALNERFEKHTMRIFERHGMENVAYWVPTDKPESENTLIYLLRHKSRAAAQKSWEAFRADPDWKKVAAEWKERFGRVLVAGGVQSTYLEPTDYSGEVGRTKPDSLYELRIYTAADGKLDALHARFRDHTDKLFSKHGIRSVGYWSPIEQAESEQLMLYVLEHADREAAAKAWKAFGQDPQWRAAKQASEVDGRLVTKVKRFYMKQTDYSPRSNEVSSL